MKISISLPDADVVILDEFVRAAALTSRSAAVQHAVRMLRHAALEQEYDAAWQEWEESGEQAAWDVTASDGLVDAAR